MVAARTALGYTCFLQRRGVGMRAKWVERKLDDRRKRETGLPADCRYDRRNQPERRPIQVREITMEEFESALIEQALGRLRKSGDGSG